MAGAYAFRDEFAVYYSSPLWNDTGKAFGNWRIHAETLFDNGWKVFETAGGFDGDHGVVSKRASELFNQLLHLIWIPRKEVDGTRE